jgi:signal transduction histidine kinase
MDSALKRLIDAYFSSPNRVVKFTAGEVVIEQNNYNERLYYVREGELEALYTEHEFEQPVSVFVAGKGAFIGVHSFFSRTLIPSSTVVAKTDVELAWIDNRTLAVDADEFGSLYEQFMPLMVSELSRRQQRATLGAIEKEEALQKLNAAEQMTTLGQLAAGIAHELNNAVGVLSSKSDRMYAVLLQLVEETHPQASAFIDQGLIYGQSLSSSEVRLRAKKLESELGVPKAQAKQLAKAMPDDASQQIWIEQPNTAVRFWEIGRDLHDMKLAAKHAVSIVKSVKQLGRVDINTEESININDSINKALSLLQSELRSVSVHISPADLPLFKGSSTELVQVWANIVKNACDAMEGVDEPSLTISTRVSNNKILVTMANNGPEIDEATRRKIFQPNFTTKKGGLSFGLGLGLSIVKRIISGYDGTIVVKSDAKQTVFRIKLPLGE